MPVPDEHCVHTEIDWLMWTIKMKSEMAKEGAAELETHN